MPSTTSHIPLPGASLPRPCGAATEPVFNAPVRWSLVVLSWLAFGVASYLAFHSVSGSSVAWCGVGDNNSCDIVLTSSWSKWIGVPVAVLGLGCYATLASLSTLLVFRAAAPRVISTIFVMLAIVAAGASLWFIGVQMFAIHSYCQYCLVADTCGVALGIIVATAALLRLLARRGTPQPRTMQPGLMALRTALPAGPRVATSTASTTLLPASPPSLAMAFAGALPLLALLIGGQLLFAAKTYQVEKLALGDSIKMNEVSDVKSGDSAAATTHVAMRPTSDNDVSNAVIGHENEIPGGSQSKDQPSASSIVADAPASIFSRKSSDEASKDAAEPLAESKHERLVKFLGGKLTLDVYKHPLIGSPEAPHIAIEMVSYDCTHCRKMHETIQHALDRYGDQVALLVMPVPLDKECNKLITDPTIVHQGACGTARLVIALAKLAPTEFANFHDFLMSGGDKPPGMEKIIPKAYTITSPDRLRELSRSPQVAKQLETYVDLFGMLQAKSSGSKTFGLPVQILGDTVISGSVEKEEDVFKAWEEHLGVKPN
ncbi:MAG TPA: vitamin K epoxide reductase family protein [Lacipirellulaceae bacterium]|jgi:uncharacterized membrane protein|nr:vitamin K epoxide reductase family protein [Lacipirellulaceae bacterium]